MNMKNAAKAGAALVLAGAIFGSLAGCGKTNSSGNGGAPAQPAVSQAASQAPEQSQAPAVAAGVSCADIWANIEKAVEELPAMMDLDKEGLETVYEIPADNLDDFICKTPLMNVQATEFFIGKVKPGKMDEVVAALEKRQSNLVEQWKTYLPEQFDLVEKYQLKTAGDYVFFGIAEKAELAVNTFSETLS